MKVFFKKLISCEDDPDVACSLATLETVHYKDDEQRTILHFAVQWNCLKLVRKCLEMKANVDAKDTKENTPLFYSPHIISPIARLLLDAGANINFTNKYGWTLINNAVLCINIPFAKMLIDYGALIHGKDVSDLIVNKTWIVGFIEQRLECRRVAILMIGIQKYKLSNTTYKQDINVLRLVGKHVWSMRMDE